jgi:hypothetical protein
MTPLSASRTCWSLTRSASSSANVGRGGCDAIGAAAAFSQSTVPDRICRRLAGSFLAGRGWRGSASASDASASARRSSEPCASGPASETACEAVCICQGGGIAPKGRGAPTLLSSRLPLLLGLPPDPTTPARSSGAAQGRWCICHRSSASCVASALHSIRAMPVNMLPFRLKSNASQHGTCQPKICAA